MRRLLAGRGALERTLVHVQVELEPHLQQQPPLDHARWHIRRADGPEQDRVEAAQLLQDLVAEDLAVAQVAGATEIEVGGVELDAGGVPSP